MPGKLRVTQTKSTISHIARNRGTIRALGLHGIGDTVEVPDNDATRGMVRQVRFLVEVEELPEAGPEEKLGNPPPGAPPRAAASRGLASAVASPRARARPPDAARRVRSRERATARLPRGSKAARPRSTFGCPNCTASRTVSASNTRAGTSAVSP